LISIIDLYNQKYDYVVNLLFLKHLTSTCIPFHEAQFLKDTRLSAPIACYLGSVRTVGIVLTR